MAAALEAHAVRAAALAISHGLAGAQVGAPARATSRCLELAK